MSRDVSVNGRWNRCRNQSRFKHSPCLFVCLVCLFVCLCVLYWFLLGQQWFSKWGAGPLGQWFTAFLAGDPFEFQVTSCKGCDPKVALQEFRGTADRSLLFVSFYFMFFEKFFKLFNFFSNVVSLSKILWTQILRLIIDDDFSFLERMFHLLTSFIDQRLFYS